MNVAIYSRKSKFTGTGDSVENQIQMCRDHLAYLYRDKPYTVTVYEDEGYTGKNTNRPMFQQMMKSIEQREIDIIICYRLDRLSRSVSDFSILLDTLSKYGVEFISVSENFDTSTPMGRAMINIASVFAQLERETIAERVKDNKILIAKTGRWQGGRPPLGYKTVTYTAQDTDGKNRTCYYLQEDEGSERLEMVKHLFDKFLELKSITQLETYLLKNRMWTINENEYTSTVLKQILINPVYATNHPAVYDYFSKTNCVIANPREEFDDTVGMMGYGKTASDSCNRRRNPLDDWLISFGKHKGIISGELWVQIQNIMRVNAAKFPRMETSDVAIFSGMIRCTCGSPMLVKGNRQGKGGVIRYYYKCMRKDKSHGELCNISNISGPEFDHEVMQYIRNIVSANSSISGDLEVSLKKVAQNKQDAQKAIKQKQQLIAEKEKTIEQLVLRLTDTRMTKNVLDYIDTTISTVSDEINTLKIDLLSLDRSISNANTDKENLLLINQRVSELLDLPETATVPQKRELIKSIIDRIYWDGDNFTISLYTDKITGG